MTITEKVTKILVEQLGVDVEEVTPGALLRDDLGGDSMDGFEIMMALEEEFGIEITDEDAERWITVRDVIAYLEGRKVKV